MNKKSQAFLFLIFIMSILVIGFTYVILSKPMSILYNQYQNDSDMNDVDAQNFYIRSNTIWEFILIPIAIALILWTIIEVQRKKDMQEY